MKSVGELSQVCSQTALKCLYFARIGRPDILRSVNKLARSIAKWTKPVTNAWIDWYLTFMTHGNINSIGMWVILPNNAGWDCFETPILQEIRRTQNQHQVEHCVFGSHTFVPISWMCKKQTSVSHSSTESEIIYLDAGLRLDGIHALDLWDLIVATLYGNTYQSNQERRDPCANIRAVPHKPQKRKKSQRVINDLNNIDCVPWHVQFFRIKKLRCMWLKTTKQWLRWS